jgi:hypothetical protein
MLLVAGFCLAVAVTFFFGYRAGRTARHVRWQNEPIRAWMTVPFVAHTHHASEEALFRAIHLEPNPHDHRPIRDIARTEHVPVKTLIDNLQNALATSTAPAGAPPSGRAP